MIKSNQIVIFTLDEHPYALYLSAVERIWRIVEIAPLPKAPQIVLGVVNIQGRIIPVINVRKRFQLQERDLHLSDQLIIAQTSERTVALVVDAVTGVVECPAQSMISAEEIVPGMEYVEGVVKLQEGMILIHDLERFLSLQEDAALEKALTASH